MIFVKWWAIILACCCCQELRASKLPSAKEIKEASPITEDNETLSNNPKDKSTKEEENDVTVTSFVHVTVKPKSLLDLHRNASNDVTNESNFTLSDVTEVEVESESSDVAHNNSNGGTTIYVIGIIGVIPAAGIIAWCIRYFWRRNKMKTNKHLKSSRMIAARDRHNGKVQYSRSTSVKTLDMDISASRNRNNQQQQINEESDRLNDESQLKKSQSIWEFCRESLRLKNVLGEGNFGKVWKAEADNICGIDGTVLVAVKTVKSNASNKEKEDLLKEMAIMKKISYHPNVVTMLGCCRDQEPYYLILEYVMYGKLLTYLRDHRSKKNYYNFSDDACVLTSQDLTTFAYHVARGMEYLSSKGVLHRDLAARNILVDHTKTCKIADFGLSRTIKNGDSEMYEQKTKAALPIRWMAPESLFLSVFTIKSDVWSFGILMWEIVTLGSTPYPGLGARDVIKEVREGTTPEKPHHCKPELYSIMKSCWAKDPEERPHFTGLVNSLGQLLEKQTGYIDLENFPDNCYFNMYHSTGEKV